MLISRFDTRNINLLPLDGHVIGFEDCLNGFGHLSTDPITYIRYQLLLKAPNFPSSEQLTRYKRCCVFPAKFGRLKYIRLHCRHSYSM